MAAGEADEHLVAAKPRADVDLGDRGDLRDLREDAGQHSEVGASHRSEAVDVERVPRAKDTRVSVCSLQEIGAAISAMVCSSLVASSPETTSETSSGVSIHSGTHGGPSGIAYGDGGAYGSVVTVTAGSGVIMAAAAT